MLQDILSIAYWRARFSSAPAKRYDEFEVSFISNGNVLVGTLTIPHRESEPRNTLAILIHGSGPMDRDETNYGHKPFAVIAHELGDAGYAVFRFDKRGVGASGGDYSTATTLDFADDVLAAIKFVKNILQNRDEKLVLIGHSEGGMIASLVAGKSELVDGVVMLAAPAVRGDALMLSQIVNNCVANGLSEEETQAQYALAKQCYELLEQHPEDAEAIPLILARIAANKDEAIDRSFMMARIDPTKITSNWYRTFLFYDPIPAIRALKCPVLAIHGLNDRQVYAADQLPPMRSALAESAADYSVVEVRGVNHILQNSPTGATSEYAGIKQTVDPMVIGLVRNFIQRAFVR